MADHSNGKHRVIESSIGSAESSKVAVAMEKSPSRSKKYRKVSIFKKSASHDDGSVSKGSGRGKRKGSKEKKSEGIAEVHDVVEQPTATPIPEILAASPVHLNHHFSDSEVNHYEIHTQDHEEKSTADLSVKQLHKLNKELTKQRRSMDSLKRDRENILSEKTKVKNEKVLKKGGSKNDLHHRLSKKQSLEDGLGGCYADEMKFRVKELEDQLAERDYKITALRLSIEKNSEHHTLGSDSMELESDRPAGGGGAKRTTNGGILDATVVLERLLEEQDMSLKLRRENAELRSHILAMDIEWEKFHKDSDPSPRSPRKRSSGFFKRGKKSTSSMPSRRVNEETTPHDGARFLKRSPSPDIGGGKSDTQHQDVEISDILLLSRFNKESTSSLPCYGSPNQSPQMAAKNRTGSDLGTLQACLKLALSEKSLFEENNASLQKELDSAREKLNELEKSLEFKMEEAVSKLQKSFEAVEIDRDTYRDELKISQQELDEMLEKQRSLGKLHLEALKAKDNRIKQLEEKLESNKKPPPSPTYGGSASSTSSKKPSAFGSTAFSLARSNSREVSTSHNAPQSITSPTQAKDVVSPTRISSTGTNTTTQGTSNAAKASDVTSPTKFSSSSSSSKDVTSPTRSAILQSPTKVVCEKKVASSSSSTQASDAPKQCGFVRKLSKDLSSEKLSGLPPSTSSTRKIGKLSRESSIEKFEVAKETPQASGTKRRDSNTGIPPPSPSSSFTKVAATRAMFEQKIDQTKTSNVQIRRQLKSTGDSVEEKRRFSLGGTSASTPENKPRTATMHSKSNSYDLSSKLPTASPKTSSATIPEVVPDTSSSSKQDTVTPTSGERSMPNGPASVTNDDRNRTDNINRQQQEKKVNSTSVSGSSKPSSDSVFSSSSSNRVSSPTKVSKITITSTASPTNSPLPTGRKEMAAKVGQGSGLLIRNPTSPCLGGTKRTPSPTSSSTRILCGQLSSPAKVGIPTRKSSSSSFKGNDTEVSSGNSVASSSSSSSDSKTQANSKSQAPVRKQQSQVISSWSKTEKPSSSVSVVSSMKSSNSSSSSSSSSSSNTSSSTPSASSATRPSTTVTTNSSVNISTSASNATSSTSATITTSSSTTTNSINKINGQKSSSSSAGTSNSKLTSPVAKMGSLQNIQSYLNGTNGEESKGSVMSTAPSNTPSNSSSVSTSSSSTAVTANSGVKRGPTHRALQRRDRKDRPKTMYAGRAETTNLVNLISKFQEEEKEKKLKSASVISQPAMAPSKPTQNGNSSMVVSNSATTINNVTMRQPTPGNFNRPRPATFYIPDSSPSSTSNADKSGLSSSYSSKPPPHERRLMRSQTSYGMGNNRMSKKAMLLRWCQMMTQSYENVNICNFAESFSNGLAFCALMHHFLPDQVPFSTLSATSRERNFKIAFKAAEGAGIPSLLDVEDMVSLPIPDWMSVMTYVSFIYNKFGQESQQQQQNQSSMV